LSQLLVHELLTSGEIDRHLPTIVRTYRQRRDAMLIALAEHFPRACRWTRPHGGMFVWVTLPPEIDASELLARAIEQRVAFVPGAPFHPDGGARNTLRLNFTNASPERIHEGIRRLGQLLGNRIELRAAVASTGPRRRRYGQPARPRGTSRVDDSRASGRR
jgi:2-aminoadipate transaminase